MISELTESTVPAHDPTAPASTARWVILPSLPTTVLTRSISPAMR